MKASHWRTAIVKKDYVNDHNMYSHKKLKQEYKMELPKVILVDLKKSLFYRRYIGFSSTHSVHTCQLLIFAIISLCQKKHSGTWIMYNMSTFYRLFIVLFNA